jgi:tetratricopeptide (TPR) repeat protein
MLELNVRPLDQGVMVELAGIRHSLPESSVVPLLDGSAPLRQGAEWGRHLAATLLAPEQQAILRRLEADDRLLLDIPDPRLASIPWEGLRIDDRLLAAHCSLVRWVAAKSAPPRPPLGQAEGLLLLALPVAPTDGRYPALATEEEFRGLRRTVLEGGRSLTLLRVQPPTVAHLAEVTDGRGPTCLFFMGHSDSRDGRAVLEFEDRSGRTRVVGAEELAATLGASASLVVLNSCWSARAGQPTEMGNIAAGLVERGIPYALGMQSMVPDDAAPLLSQTLLREILAGQTIEAAVRLARQTLLNSKLPLRQWVATVPVLYTHQREPMPALNLPAGEAVLVPSPEATRRMDLSALPEVRPLLGRGRVLSASLDALLSQKPPEEPAPVVVLHGLGGIGKTALARAVAERAAWSFGHRVLAISFEATPLDSGRFLDDLRQRLGALHDLAVDRFPTAEALEAALLETRRELRTLLVLDNLETVFEGCEDGNPEALALDRFLRRLRVGAGALLVTSRRLPPAPWDPVQAVEVGGLDDQVGGELLRGALPPEAEAAIDPEIRRTISQRVEGHPLSLRLLGARLAHGFDQDDGDRGAAFLDRLESELAKPQAQEEGRQGSLDACLATSVDRLPEEERRTLTDLSLFDTPFSSLLAAEFLTLESAAVESILESLTRQGLLQRQRLDDDDSSLHLFSLHPTVRWHVRRRFGDPRQDPALRRRQGEAFFRLIGGGASIGAVNRGGWFSKALALSLPDLEVAAEALEAAQRSILFSHLVRLYERLGRLREARRLAERALELAEAEGNPDATLLALLNVGDLMNKTGENPKTTFAIYQRALDIVEESGAVHNLGISAHRQIGELLGNQGRHREALEHYRKGRAEADRVELPDPALQALGKAELDAAIASTLSRLGEPEESLHLFPGAIRTFRQYGDLRNAAITLDRMASTLLDLKRYPDALVAQEEGLAIMGRIGAEPRAIAVLEGNRGMTLKALGRVQEAVDVHRRALETLRQVGDHLEASVVEEKLAVALFHNKQFQPAIQHFWAAYQAAEDYGWETTQQRLRKFLTTIKEGLGGQFDLLWAGVIPDPQPPWLTAISVTPAQAEVESFLSERIVNTLIQGAVEAMTPGNEAAHRKFRQWLVHADGRFPDHQSAGRAFNSALIHLLDGEATLLPPTNHYALVYLEIVAMAEKVSGRSLGGDPQWPQLQNALHRTFTAAGPTQLQQVFQEEGRWLCRPEVDAFLYLRSFQEKAAGNPQLGESLEDLRRMIQRLTAGETPRVVENPDISPEHWARTTADAIWTSAAERQRLTRTLEEHAARAEDETEKRFLHSLAGALARGGADFQSSLEEGKYRDAWALFQRLTQEGATSPETLRAFQRAVVQALDPESSSDAVGEARSTLNDLRNDALEAGAHQQVLLAEAGLALVDQGEAEGAADALGEGLRGPFRDAWQALLTRLRSRGPRRPLSPETHQTLERLIQSQEQTAVFTILREERARLVNQRTVDQLLWLEQEHAGEGVAQMLRYHRHMLEKALRQGLPAALTGDAIATFGNEDDPEKIIALFEACGPELSLEEGEKAFADLLEINRTNRQARVYLTEKRNLFRRIAALGPREAFAEARRLEKLNKKFQKFVIAMAEDIDAARQRKVARKHRKLIERSEYPILVAQHREILVAHHQEDPAAAETLRGATIQSAILGRCHTEGIDPTFDRLEKIFARVLRFLNAGAPEAMAQIAREDTEKDLLTEESWLSLFLLQHQEAGNPDTSGHIRRARRLLDRWRTHGDVEAAILEESQYRQHEVTLATALSELLRAGDATEKRRILEEHRAVLLTPEAEAQLMATARSMLQNLQTDEEKKTVAALFEEDRNLLRRCREVGLDATFGPG